MEHHPTPAAELARTVLTGVGTATIESALLPTWGSRSVPILHAQTAEGVSCLAADAGDLSALGLGAQGLGPEPSSGPNPGPNPRRGPRRDPRRDLRQGAPVVLQVRVMAPVADLTVFRATVRIAGWVRHVGPREVPAVLRARCAGVALGDVVGHRATTRLLRFTPADATVHTEEGVTLVTGAALAAARPDAFAAVEGPLLAELENRVAPLLPGLFERALREGSARTLCTGEPFEASGSCATCPRRCAPDPGAHAAGSAVRLIGVTTRSVSLCAVLASDELRCRATDQVLLTVVELPLPRPVAGLAEAAAALRALAPARVPARGELLLR